MARIILTSSSHLTLARRNLRRSGFSLTVRYGKVYTYKISRPSNPQSTRQQNNRSTFSQANTIVARQLKQPRLLRHWRLAARRLGYKTARGAAIAYWCNVIKLNTSHHHALQTLTTRLPHFNMPPARGLYHLSHTFFMPEHIPIGGIT